MRETIKFATYGLLMPGQSLNSKMAGEFEVIPGHFLGSLYEVQQTVPFDDNSELHYPVALLDSRLGTDKIRCQIFIGVVEDVKEYWRVLDKTEYCSGTIDSLMRRTTIEVVPDDGDSLNAQVYLANPDCPFTLGHFGLFIRQIHVDDDEFVSWEKVEPWPKGK